MPNESNQHKFQVNLRGVIDLLSDHLYSGPQVYLREALQNAVDAVVARCAIEPDHVGQIKLELVKDKSGTHPTLVIHDNGIGLSESEVHQFLATIGQSSKRDVTSEADFIGQFGVGLLSGFVVSEEIVVISRSISAEAKTVQWKGRNDGTYEVGELDFDAEPGTEVYLRAKPGCHDFFDFDFVVSTARNFGSLLPFEIRISNGEQSVTINEIPPWRSGIDDPGTLHDISMQFGEHVFDSQFLDAIPLSSEAGGVNGIAYVLPKALSMNGRQQHRVYLKNMLLSENVDGLLPNWAFFIRCIVNSRNLRPLASREGLYEDGTLEETRQQLGQSIRQYLIDLSKYDPQKLQHLLFIHHLSIKALAVEDDDFFRMVIDWLPFETNFGVKTIGEYYKEFDTVQYVTSRDRFRQVAPVSAAQNICIVNAHYAFDAELIQRLPLMLSGRKIKFVDATNLSDSLRDLTIDERDRVFDFVKLANLVMQPYQVEVDIKKFQPENLPVLYTTNESADFLRSIDQAKEAGDELLSGVLDSLAPTASSAQAQLCLNMENPMIQQLVQVNDRDLQSRAIETLYIQSLLLGHYPLKTKEMNLLSTGLSGWIQLCLERSQDDLKGEQS